MACTMILQKKKNTSKMANWARSLPQEERGVGLYTPKIAGLLISEGRGGGVKLKSSL